MSNIKAKPLGFKQLIDLHQANWNAVSGQRLAVTTKEISGIVAAIQPETIVYVTGLDNVDDEQHKFGNVSVPITPSKKAHGLVGVNSVTTIVAVYGITDKVRFITEDEINMAAIATDMFHKIYHHGSYEFCLKASELVLAVARQMSVSTDNGLESIQLGTPERMLDGVLELVGSGISAPDRDKVIKTCYDMAVNHHPQSAIKLNRSAYAVILNHLDYHGESVTLMGVKVILDNHDNRPIPTVHLVDCQTLESR